MGVKNKLEVLFQGSFLSTVIGAVREDGQSCRTTSPYLTAQLLNLELLAEEPENSFFEITGATPPGFTPEMIPPIASVAQRLLEPLYRTEVNDKLSLGIGFKPNSGKGEIQITYPSNAVNALRIPPSTWTTRAVSGEDLSDGQSGVRFKKPKLTVTKGGEMMKVTLPFKVIR